MHWSFLVPQRVTVEQCLTWLRTRTYRPEYHSTMMHGKEFSRPIHLDEPNYITYLVYGRTFPQAPALLTDQVTDIACQGEWYEYQAGQPQNHIIAFYDELYLRTIRLSTKTASCLSLALGTRVIAMPGDSPTCGTSPSPITAQSRLSRNSSDIGCMPT